MKRIVIKKDGIEKQRKGWTFSQRIFFAWTFLNFAVAFCLALYSISNKWGSGTLAKIWIILLSCFAVLFVLIVIAGPGDDAKIYGKRLKACLTGLKITIGISNLINLAVSLIVLIVAYLRGDMNSFVAMVSVTVLFLFTLVGLILNIEGIKKQRKKKSKRN